MTKLRAYVSMVKLGGSFEGDAHEKGFAAVALLAALPLAGCNTPGERAAGGALLGGAAGAAIGGAATGRGSGALAGAAIGAASGAVIGAATTPRRCARVGYDYYGNRVCVRYYDY